MYLLFISLALFVFRIRIVDIKHCFMSCLANIIPTFLVYDFKRYLNSFLKLRMHFTFQFLNPLSLVFFFLQVILGRYLNSLFPLWITIALTH